MAVIHNQSYFLSHCSFSKLEGVLKWWKKQIGQGIHYTWDDVSFNISGTSRKSKTNDTPFEGPDTLPTENRGTLASLWCKMAFFQEGVAQGKEICQRMKPDFPVDKMVFNNLLLEFYVSPLFR